MSLLNRALSVYRSEGAGPLLKKVAWFLRTKSLFRIGRVYTAAVPPLPPLTMRKSVDGVTGRFRVSTRHEWPRIVGRGERQLRDFLSRLRTDDVVFDAGANIGLYAILAAQRVTDGQVIAFEPHPHNAERLRHNAELNGGGVDVRDVALADADGTARLRLSAERPGDGKAALANGDSNSEQVTVPTRRGDTLVNTGDAPPPTVVKIDVEGAEQRVIEGLAETLRRPECRLVYCEVHTPPGESTAVENALSRCEFAVERIDEASARYHIRAEQQ